MKFKGNKSSAIVNVSIGKYLVDWERKVSGPQKRVKDFLKNYWYHATVLEEFLIPGVGKLRIDLFKVSGTQIAVEVSPESSHSYNKFFHGSRESGFLSSVKRDFAKQEWCENNGVLYVELKSKDIDNLSLELFKEKFGVEL